MPVIGAPLHSIVNQIKQLLVDRYDGGFTILKELIQNADDAGASELAEIGRAHV